MSEDKNFSKWNGSDNEESALQLSDILAMFTSHKWAYVIFTALCLFAECAVPSKREADHTEGVLREEVKEITGAVGQVAPAFRIPKSIAFHKVTLETPDGPVFLKLNARHRKGFPETGERIRAEIRREYITAWEVIP